jgi:UDP-glucose:(heptosyl)LPS alpha-1,3-glucosyltransferase
MKLACCLFHYYPYGGLERDFMRIASAAQQRGHTVHVFTMHWEGENPQQFPITYIPMKGLSNHARCAAFAEQLKQYLQDEHYDLVLGFNRMPNLDVYYAADICFQSNARYKHGAWYRLTPRYRTLVNLEQAVFAPTAKTKILSLVPAEQKNYSHYYGTPAQRFYSVPPGIDKDRIPSAATPVRATLRAEFKFTDDDLLLLMVGSDFKRKGVDRALHAVAALPTSLRERCRLLIIGKGKAQPLLRLAKSLNIMRQVYFLGPRNDIGRFMVAANLLLHPAYHETAGMVLLEALVAGLPVLVTENCGYAFHIQQANAGLIVPMPYQQITLNEYLARMLNSEQRIIWQTNARAYAATADLYSLPQRAVDLLEQFHLAAQNHS